MTSCTASWFFWTGELLKEYSTRLHPLTLTSPPHTLLLPPPFSLPPLQQCMVARCLLDNDDEVRDRALLYLEVLKQKQKALSSAYILNSKSVCTCGEGWERGGRSVGEEWKGGGVRERGRSEEKACFTSCVHEYGNAFLSLSLCCTVSEW